MTLAVAAIHTTLAAPDEGATVPAWVHLIPAGKFGGVDGRGPYLLDDAQGVIEASMAAADGRLPIDENHSTDRAAPEGRPAPALGWIVELQARADGIWGRVEWTTNGEQMVADRAYRGVSPVFLHTRAGVVRQLLRAALTNTPNLTDLHTLHTQQGYMMDLTVLRAALGLPETADEAAITAAIAERDAAIAGHAAEIRAIVAAAGLDEALQGDALITALQAARATPPAALTALQAQLTELRTERARERAEMFVDGAIRAGKPIVANRDRLIAAHMADAAGTEALVNAMPSINAGGQVVRPGGGGEGEEPDALAVEMAAKTGFDPKKIAAHRAQLRGEREERGAV
jgi:phage I-like protein